MKTYADKTKALAADVILQAACDEAAALLRDGLKPTVTTTSGGPYVTCTIRIRTAYEIDLTRARVDAILLAAAQSADLLLAGAR